MAFTRLNSAQRPMRLAAIVLMSLAVLVAGGCKKADARFRDARIGGENFRLELAITDAQLHQGMMGRATVGANEGMIFVFPDIEVRGFWMKGCLIPLDILFLDGQGRIVSLTTMEIPKPDASLVSYSSRWAAQFAVEMRAGTIARLKLHEGDKVEMPVEELKGLARQVDK